MKIKNNNNRKFIFLLVFSLVFLSSCSLNNNLSQSDVGEVDNSYKFGNVGVTLNIENLKRSEIFENSAIQFLLSIKNEGQHNSNVIISEPTYDSKYFESIQLQNDFSFNEIFLIDGKSIYQNIAHENKIPIEIMASTLPATQDQRTEDLVFSICYDYKTYFEEDVCVDTDVYDLKNDESVCTVGEKSFSKGQGAPIKVNKLDVYYQKTSDIIVPIIEFELRNSGQGTILTNKGYDLLCTSTSNSDAGSLTNEISLTKLKFSKFTLSDFDCDEISFENDVANVRCTLNDGITGFSESEGNFLAKIEMEFSYYYKDAKTIPITIKKS